MNLGLSRGEIHLWLASLEAPAANPERLWGLLSKDERLRAERFHFEKERNRFIASRGTLRNILSGYLNLPPERLEFQYGAGGKPALSEGCNPMDLRFNLSHSHTLALYALLRHQEIGVDLEHVHPVKKIETLAQRFFSLREYERLHSLPNEQKLVAFFNCWTRKEVYLKAGGDGLSEPLERFEVSLAPNEPARLLSIDGSCAGLCRPWVTSQRWPLKVDLGR